MPRQPTPRPINIRKDPTVRKGRIKSSKRVLDRIKAAGALIGAIEALKAEAAAGFGRRLAAELRDGETMPDLTLALELNGRAVQTALDALVEADRRYCGHGVRRKNLTAGCVYLAKHQIYPELRDVRREIESRFGQENGRRVHGMTGKTRRKPRAQLPQLKHLVTTLREPRELPAPRRPGAAGETEDWLERLEPGYDRLSRKMKEREQMERREERLRDDRDFELECFDIDYSEAVAFVRSVFRIGGCSDKATWELLPTVQRRRLKAKARQEREARAGGRRNGKARSDSGGAPSPGASVA